MSRNKKISLTIFLIIVLGSFSLSYIKNHMKEKRYGSAVQDNTGFFSSNEEFTEFISEQEPDKWVTVYYPEKSFNGYNLVFLKSRIPALMDMNGNIVHCWYNVKGRYRMRLGRDGKLLVLGIDNSLKEYDWDRRLKWEFRHSNRNDFPHHDFIMLKNGNILLIYRDSMDGTDYLLEIDRAGAVVWEWHSSDYLDEYFRGKIPSSKDPTHFNSVQEIQTNKWYEGGDLRFRPGNLLVSARNLNSIFIVDRKTGDIVWQYDNALDNQHEALMIDRNYPGEGHILLFNNGRMNLYRYRQSRIEEVNPHDGTCVCKYESKYFFSYRGGSEQILPNGNILISSSVSHRAFEINPEREIVWQWTPPFVVRRSQRVPYDYSPQFATLPRPVEKPVYPTPDQPYIDKNLYEFALMYEYSERRIEGNRKKILLKNDMCRRLLIPPEATLTVAYGLDFGGKFDKYDLDPSAIFRITLQAPGSSEKVILQDTLNAHYDPAWIKRQYPLHDYAYQYINLCLEAKNSDTSHEPHDDSFALWETPTIISASSSSLDISRWNRRLMKHTGEIEKQQLRALGYVE